MPNKITKNNAITFVALFIILLSGLSLRLYQIDSNSLWFDEASSFFHAKQSVADIWLNGATGSLPPLYYVLLHYWMCIGENEFILRLLSLIFGVVAIFIIYLLGKNLFNEETGLLSAFLLSVSPFHIYYSQEAKGYALLAAVALFSIYFFVKVLKTGNFSAWVFFVIFTALSLYTHYFALFTLFAENIFFILWKEKRYLLKRWLAVQAVIFFIFLPWLYTFLFKHLSQVFNFTAGWLPKGDWKSVFVTFKNFTVGYHAAKQAFLFPAGLFFLFFTIGSISIRKTRREQVLLLLLTFIPVITVLILSQRFNIYNDRYLILASLSYYILVACGIAYFKKIKTVLCIGIIILLFPAFKNLYSNIIPDKKLSSKISPKEEYRPAANFVKENIQSGDVIVHSCLDSYIVFQFYHKKKFPEYYAILHPQYIKTQFENQPSQGNLIKYGFAPSMIEGVVKGYKRAWLVMSSWQDSYIGHIDYEAKKWMDSHYIEIGSKDFLGIKVYIYLLADNSGINKVFDDGINSVYYYPFNGKLYSQKGISDYYYSGSRKTRGRAGEVAVFLKGQVIKGNSLSFAVKNDSSKIHNYEYEVIYMDEMLEAESFYRSSRSAQDWLLCPWDLEGLPDSLSEGFKQLSEYQELTYGNKNEKNLFSLEAPWNNNIIMITNVGGFERRESAAIEKEINFAPGEYDVFARIVSLPQAERAGLYFYANDKLIWENTSEVFKKAAAVEWIYIGRIKKTAGKSLVLYIEARNDYSLPQALAGIDKMVFLKSKSLDNEDKAYSDYVVVKNGEFQVFSKESKIIDIYVNISIMARERIGIIINDKTSGKYYTLDCQSFK